MCALCSRVNAVTSLQAERTTDVGVILTATSVSKRAEAVCHLAAGKYVEKHASWSTCWHRWRPGTLQQHVSSRQPQPAGVAVSDGQQRVMRCCPHALPLRRDASTGRKQHCCWMAMQTGSLQVQGNRRPAHIPTCQRFALCGRSHVHRNQAACHARSQAGTYQKLVRSGARPSRPELQASPLPAASATNLASA